MTAGAGTGVGPRERDGDAEGDIVRGGRGGGASRVTRQSAGGGGGTSTSSRSLGRVLAALVAGLIIGGVATALYLQSTDDGGDETAFTNAIDETRYQAVILSNDKVYFGQLVSISDDFFELESAFFLRETRADADAEPVRALLPVNREIHAPDNTMLIRKSEVVLVENLAKDSPILTEIKRQKG
ncbi:MAG TPA: hypothetical protein VM143_12115 [Acidimicrobiales bacterium]|nr:hypothetical protein [Acidimicrobiales bacterium]